MHLNGERDEHAERGRIRDTVESIRERVGARRIDIARHWMSEHPPQRVPPDDSRGTGGDA